MERQRAEHPESTEERMRRLMWQTSLAYEQQMLQEKQKIAQIKKEVGEEKEEFDYKKYIKLKFGSEPKEIDPIGAHVEAASYYIDHQRQEQSKSL